jgi:hypothetical protein
MERRTFLGSGLLAVFAAAMLSACGGGGKLDAPPPALTPPPTGVTVQFQNLRPDASTVPVYITFGGSDTLVATNIANGQSIVKGQAYTLAQLSSGVNITEYRSGRIFVSLGVPLVTPTEANGYAPNFDNSTLGDFTTRWDKFEITVTPANGNVATSGGANLTSQDFFGIPLDITTTGGSQPPDHLTWRADTATVFQALGQLSNFSVITPQNSPGAIALGNNGVPIPGVSGGNVVRVVSPGSVAPLNPQNGTTVYPSLQSYIAYLATGNPQPIPTTIQGNNGQPISGGPYQTYDLTATIANAPTTIGGVAINVGDLVLTGTMNAGTGGGDAPYTIVVPASNLTDYGIYLANPSFTTIPANTNPDNIAQHIVADYFAALNFGIVGSTVANPNDPGSTLGNSPSWTWYGNEPTGAAAPKLPIADAFSAAQPSNSNRYNSYAAYLAGVTDSYGFAYNDRLESPLAAVSDGTLLTLSVLADER